MALETAALVAGIAGSVIGGGASIFGGIMNYNQQNAQADAQEKAFRNEQQNAQNIAEYNAKLAEQQANETAQANAEKEKRLRQENERTLSLQRAMFGKSGAALYSGSPLAVLGHTAANNEMAAQDLRREGAAQVNDIRQQGQMYKYNGSVSAGQSFYRPSYSGSLLSGIAGGVSQFGQAGAQYATYQYNQGLNPKYDNVNTMRGYSKSNSSF